LFYRKVQTLSKINHGPTKTLKEVLKLMFCGMYNEEGWAEKHRQMHNTAGVKNIS
jgi:hypothetical protein